jgi:hypothetical protein
MLPSAELDVIKKEQPVELDHTDVVEVPLLLLTWQMSALEQVAHLRGITAAEMVRQVLREFIADHAARC